MDAALRQGDESVVVREAEAVSEWMDRNYTRVLVVQNADNTVDNQAVLSHVRHHHRKQFDSSSSIITVADNDLPLDLSMITAPVTVERQQGDLQSAKSTFCWTRVRSLLKRINEFPRSDHDVD